MYNIDHFKSLIGAELEALVTEISELKKRVVELEGKAAMQSLNSNVHSGQWIDKKIKNSSMITCNTSEIF